MTRCLIAVGTNLGNRAVALDRALSALSKLPSTTLLARSRWHETTPVGGPAGQEIFFNGAIVLETSLSARSLAGHLWQVETDFGRTRRVRWDARVLDLDILLYGNQRINEADLVIPHPRMTFRRFVLDPAVEIAGSMVHPPSGWTLAALRRQLCQAARQVVVVAGDSQCAEWLSEQLQRDFLGASQVSGRVVDTIAVRQLSRIPLSRTVAALDRPALVIALDPLEEEQLVERVLDQMGPGPLARITAAEPATVLQEARAAIRSAWPENI